MSQIDKQELSAKDILTNFVAHIAKCHKKGVEPNINPWADLLVTKEELSQAIVKAREETLNDFFLEIAKLAEPDERQPNPGELHTNMDDIFEIKEALSKKEL